LQWGAVYVRAGVTKKDGDSDGIGEEGFVDGDRPVNYRLDRDCVSVAVIDRSNAAEITNPFAAVVASLRITDLVLVPSAVKTFLSASRQSSSLENRFSSLLIHD
jgi:hypothetical protein